MSMTAITDDVRLRLEANGCECGIDEIVALCPGLTWNQVFLAIDHLSRSGQIQLQRDQVQSYKIKLVPPSLSRQYPDRLVT